MSVENLYHKPNDNRGTPLEFIEKLEHLLNIHFDDYDPCPLVGGVGVKAVDGLAPAPDWVLAYFMNPPYSRKTATNPGVERWLIKARNDQLAGKTVAILLKLDWTTEWYRKWVLPYAQTIPVLGRIKFVGFASGASFVNFVAVYRPGVVPVMPMVIYP